MSTIVGNKRIIKGWIWYDWANSAYQLTVTSVVFPIYFNNQTKNPLTNDMVMFWGREFTNTALLAYAVGFAFLFTALLSPFLSSIADYTGEKKAFMRYFTYLGAFSCIGLFFFDRAHLEVGVIFYTTALIGYLGSLVYYNSYLPEIAPPEDHDRISAQGFALGYVGGVVLLLFNLIFILFEKQLGFTDGTLPAKLSFLSVGIWWLVFGHYSLKRLPRNIYGRRATGNVFTNGYKELQKSFNVIIKMRVLRLFLGGFFFYTMGLLTVMYLAPSYGEKVLKVPETLLIATVMGIQLLGVVGSLAFARLSKYMGNINALLVGLVAWVLICVWGYFIQTPTEFVAVACSVGMVMGGMQALSRSTYAKFLPPSQDNTSLFSFYDVMEKMAAFIGTVSYGFIEEFTGSMRNSLLGMSVFFAVGVLFLFWILREQTEPKAERG